MKKLFLKILIFSAIAVSSTMVAAENPTDRQPLEPPKPIPYKKVDSVKDGSPGKAFTIMVLLLGGVGAGLFFIKRRFPDFSINFPLAGRSGATRRLKILETARLNTKASLYLVQFDGQTILLAQSGETISIVLNDGADKQKSNDLINKHHV